MGHVPHRLGPHVVLVGKAGAAVIAVHANKEAVHKKAIGAQPHHWPHHHLGFRLIDAPQKDDLKGTLPPDVGGDERAVGDDRQFLPPLGQHISQQGTAAAALDHDGVAILHQLRRPLRNLSLGLIVVGDTALNVVRTAQKGIAVFPDDDPPAFQLIQVLAHGDLRHPRLFGQDGDLQPVFCGEQLQYNSFTIFFHGFPLSCLF